jgi:hypothetical protein
VHAPRQLPVDRGRAVEKLDELDLDAARVSDRKRQRGTRGRRKLKVE